MTKYNIVCSKCRKKIILEADESDNPGFCPFCAGTVFYKLPDNNNSSSDVDNKVMKNVGDADYKIYEDSLRILRAIRFATILNFKLDE